MGVPDPTAAAPAAADTPFAMLGGESRVRAMVDRFYDLMDLEPGYADRRRLHVPDLS
jgi:hemoglobin